MISQGHLAITMMANQISNVAVGNISYRYVHGLLGNDISLEYELGEST